MRTVNVALANRSYEIRIGPALLRRLGPLCRKLRLGTRCVIITDSNVAPLYAKAVEESLGASGFESFVITLPAGETAKNMRQVQACYDRLAERRLERKSFVVALGGGVVGDLAGFVAATYLRGLPFVQVPTTLLAQVDSSVGGKVGVNLKAGKNLVGAFHQPRLVLCDLDTLKSLPEREYCSGLAEVVKYGVIYDAPLFKLLQKNMERLVLREVNVMARVIARCCQIKAAVVSQDETETGLRAILNFGHTVGHAIEATSGYGTYLHGEAISVGQVAAARLSTELLGMPSPEATAVKDLLKRAKLPTQIRLNSSQTEKLLTAMKLDKKVSEGEIKFVLARGIGKVEFGCRVPEAALRQVLTSLGHPVG